MKVWQNNQIELNGQGIIFENISKQPDRAKRSRYNLWNYEKRIKVKFEIGDDLLDAS